MAYFPYSDIPLDAEPQQDWAECGVCGERFPDIYPAARCPFESEHDDEVDEDGNPRPEEGA